MLVLIGLLFSALSSRYFGSEIKGEVAYISTVVSTVAIVTSFGLHQAYPFFRKTYGVDQVKKFYFNTVLALHALYLFLCILLSGFVNSFEIKIIILFIPLSSFHRISTYVATIEKPNVFQLFELIIEIIEVIVLAILLFSSSCNLYIALAIIYTKDFVVAVISCLIIHESINVENVNISLLFKLLKYGFMPMISLMLSTLNYQIDIAMMKHLDCISTSEIGVYSIGVALANKILLIPEAIKTILLARISRDKGPSEVAMVTRTCLPITLFISLGMLAFGKPFINFVYGGEYSYAYYVTIATLIGINAIMFYKFIATYYNANHLQGRSVLLLAISVILNVVLNLILLPRMNIVGGAIASTISYSVCALLFIVSFSVHSKISIRNIVILRREDLSTLFKIFKKN